MADKRPNFIVILTARAQGRRAGIERVWNEKWAVHYHLTETEDK